MKTMNRTNTLYPLKEVFTDFLEEAEKSKFIIPAYQRGYKWASTGDNSQVEVLMRDLLTAFERGAHNRYYLQFITLINSENGLEVIDGQQRLTTITILFSVLTSFNEVKSEVNFVNDKLLYQVRENFVQKFIYNNLNLILNSENWNEFIETNKESEVDIDNQDVFYIYHATKAIHNFIKNKIGELKLLAFHRYLSEQVYLIINLLDSGMNSEKVFINVNKGIRLKDEDLVKGLLITKLPLDDSLNQVRLTDNEINTKRTSIGRQWDDLSQWVAQSEIKKYFNSSTNEFVELSWLINLTFPDIPSNQEGNSLFNYLDNLTRDKFQPVSARQIFDQIRRTMLTLNDWYNDPEISNLLGIILHQNDKPYLSKIWKDLKSFKSKTELKNRLKSHCFNLLPVNKDTIILDELNYEDKKHKQKLYNLFLILDVAKFLPINGRNAYKYNFGNITSQNWSIEHIFPQNAKEFKKLTVLSGADLEVIKSILPESLDKSKLDDEIKTAARNLFNRIKNAKKECRISDEDKEILEYLLQKQAGSLHRLGNLALLQMNINSSLSNHFFDGKRKIIVEKVSKGDFVPFHTYDVFSKLVIDAGTGLHIWTKEDIEKHEQYIQKQVTKISEYLNDKG
jgi:uncharacterized protein with ParB-like and HNH nuclease domain